MCKRFCKIPSLKLKSSEWRGPSYKKPSRCHWFLGFLVLSIWAVWMAQDYTGMNSGMEYVGSKSNMDAAIEISGVDFVDDKIKTKHRALSQSMKYQCSMVSEDVLFAFQFAYNKRVMEDHIFLLCENTKIFGNAKVVQRSDKKIKCTEEYDGELRQVVRSKEITIKAIDVDGWEQIEYTTTNPKESCMIQHAIDVLELKWV